MRPLLRTAALLAAPLLAAPLAAAPPVELIRLEDAVARALAANTDLAVERESLAVATAGVEKAKGSYDPGLKVEARYRDRTDPVNSILSGSPPGEVGPSSSGVFGSASLTQLLSTGGTVSLSTSVSRERSNSFLTLLTPSYSTSFGIEVRQPLLRDRAIDPARRGLRVASIDRDRSAASMRRLVSETVAAVEKAYWALVAARREIEARRSALELAETQRTDVAARVEAGVLSESDLAEPAAAVEKRRGDLLASVEAAQRADHALKALLLADPKDPLWSVSFSPADAPETGPVTVDAAAALEEAERFRPELLEALARKSRAAVDEESARSRLLPQLDVVGGYVGRGLAGSKNPNTNNVPFSFPIVVPEALDGSLGRSYGTLVENRFPDASIGLALSLPIGNRAARADQVAARAAREQAQLGVTQVRQRIAVEVRNAVLAVETAAQRIQAAVAARRAAEVQLAAETERFSAGTTTTYFVLTRQFELTQARIVETAALTDLRKAQTELARASGTLLDDRQIRVEASSGLATPEKAPAVPPAGGAR